MTQPFISLTESQAYQALRTFLLSATINPIEVVQGQVNQVPEPEGPDFIVYNSLHYERLATNLALDFDNVIVGSISGTVLTVTSLDHDPGLLLAGTILLDNPVVLASGTVLGTGISGTGGLGTYNVSPSQVVSSEVMYAGLHAILLSTKLTVQADFHGPNSLNNILSIDALFRSDIGVDKFAELGFDVTPLYADDAHQAPFINEAQQYEDRWTIELCLQLNPVVNTPQQFATQLKAGLIEVDTTYPP